MDRLNSEDFPKFFLSLDILFLTYLHENTHPEVQKTAEIVSNFHDFFVFLGFSYKTFMHSDAHTRVIHHKIPHKIPHRTVYMRLWWRNLGPRSNPTIYNNLFLTHCRFSIIGRHGAYVFIVALYPGLRFDNSSISLIYVSKFCLHRELFTIFTKNIYF